MVQYLHFRILEFPLHMVDRPKRDNMAMEPTVSEMGYPDILSTSSIFNGNSMAIHGVYGCIHHVSDITSWYFLLVIFSIVCST